MNKKRVTQKNRYSLLFILIAVCIISYLAYLWVGSVNAADRTWAQQDWRGGQSMQTITTDTTTFLSETNIDFSNDGYITIEQDESWQLDGWEYRRRIDLNNTLENIGVVPENLNNFPVLIKLEDGVNIEYENTKDDGSDIRFVDTDDTELNYEIDIWDESGESYVWVNISQVDSGDQDYIYMYYGNDSATTTQDPPTVWSADYLAVFHNTDSETGIVSDSLGLNDAIKGTTTQPFEAEALIGNAQTYDGSNDYSRINNNFVVNPTQLTIESWFIKSSGGGSYECALHKGSANTIGSSDYWLGVDENDNLTATIGANTGVGWSAGQTAIKATYGQTYHLVATWDGSVVKVYIDGDLIKQYNLSSYGNLNNVTRMGASADGTNYQFGGDIDEMYIANTSRSAAWIAASYQVGVDDFVNYGDVESKYASSAYLISNVFDTTYPSNWGDINFTYTGSGLVSVKVRTALSDDMSGTLDWSACTELTDGSDISSNNCVEDEHRYIQYYIYLEPQSAEVANFEDISISFSASDQIAPSVNAHTVYLDNSRENGDWLNYEPTINWSAGEDNMGLEGYCISLDELDLPDSSSVLDPETTAGMLDGIDDNIANTGCPYIVDSTSVDLSTISGLTLTSDKKYLFSIKAIDYAGNVWSGDSANYQDLVWFNYDSTQPSNVMYISTPSTDFGNIEDMFFNWPISGSSQAVDNESGLLGWQYAINSSTPEHWNGTETDADLGVKYIPADIEEGLIYFTLLNDQEDIIIGNNTIYFRAIDIAGNVSTYVTGGINYGGAAPEFPEESVVTITPSSSESNMFALSWPEAVPQDGDQIDAYYYMINTQPPSSLITLENNNNVYIPTDSLNVSADKLVGAVKGTNNVYVVAVDNNQNYSPTKAIHGTFDLNSTVPDPPQNVSAADLSIKSNELWRAAITWEEPEYKGNSDLSYIIERSEDSIIWSEVATTQGLSYTDIVDESILYYYRVACMDTSNESINSPSYSTAVQIYPQGRYEEPPELISPAVVSGTTTRYAKVNWVTDRVSDSKVQIGTSSGEYFQDEMYRSDMVVNHEIELTNLSPGTQYYYRIKWTDTDGNTGISNESIFQTKPAPLVEDIVVDNVGLSYAIIKLTTSGATKARVVYGKTKSYGGSEEINTSTVSSEYSIMLNELEDGTEYHYKIILTDEEGYEYESFEDHIFQTPPKPQVSNIQIQEKKGVPIPTIEVYWESNIPVNSIVTYSREGKSLDKVDMELLEGEHYMVIEGLDSDSAYQLIVEGVDAMGNRASSGVYAFTTATDTRPPEVFDIKSEGDIQSSDIQSDKSRSAQLIISWETDEPSTSQVFYGEGANSDGYPYSTQTDSEMRYKHLIVISNLTPSKVYHFKVVSKDSASNVGESGSVTSITPKSANSVVESVLGSLSRIFGFL